MRLHRQTVSQEHPGVAGSSAGRADRRLGPPDRPRAGPDSNRCPAEVSGVELGLLHRQSQAGTGLPWGGGFSTGHQGGARLGHRFARARRRDALMRIAELSLYAIRLPLRRPIKHASAQRQSSDNLLVCCRLSDGTVGWGEGVPRSYVTGETIHGAFEQWAASDLISQLQTDCTGWPDVVSLCQQFSLAETVEDPRGGYGNALRCAIELSLLDAFGRLIRQPVSE